KTNSMKILKNMGLLLLALAFGSLSSCRKDEDKEEKPGFDDLTAGQEMAIADGLFGELKDIADQGESGSLNSYKNGGMAFASCATISLNQQNKQFTIDFGTSNCLCRDLRMRRGILEVTYTKNYWDSGNVITITPKNYYVNDYQVVG